MIVVVLLGLLPFHSSEDDVSIPSQNESPILWQKTKQFEGPQGLAKDGLSFDLDFSSAELFSGMETLPAGTLIIAMDGANQDNDDDQLRQAYGLAIHLLYADIPLKWIINSTKTNRTDIDFSASAKEKYPTEAVSFSSHDFRTGPIAIYPGFEAAAATVINSFGNNIHVYELENDTNVEIYSTLTHKPKVLVETVNSGIHTDILDDAGLTSGTHYNVGAITGLDANSCYTVVTVPHNESITNAQRAGAQNFTRNGGNFLAQCAAVRAFQNNSPEMFTGAGFQDNPGIDVFSYHNPTEPSAQFEGDIGDRGGSLVDFGFTTDPAGGTVIVSGTPAESDDDHYKAYAGRIDEFVANSGGYVHYLGGHDHSDQGANRINADRFYLNAILRPADRPEVCNLTLQPNPNDDKGELLACGTDVTVNVVDNDFDPVGNGLTVTLIGAGSDGNFVNNNDGTVTYTPTSDPWPGMDMITYQVTDGEGTTATAVLSICGPDNNYISGTVYEDADGQADYDNDECGVSGVTVHLYEDSDGNGLPDGAAVMTDVTDANGDYDFTLNLTFETPGSVMQRVAAERDDAREKTDGKVESVDKDLKIKNGDDLLQGIRFQNVSIPANASITSAYIEFTSKEDDSGTAGTTISGEEAETPGEFDDDVKTFQISNRKSAGETTANVLWNTGFASGHPNHLSDWVSGGKYQTPDLSTVVSEIIADGNTGGPEFNGSMVFFLTNDSDADERKPYSYEKASVESERPLLVINYTVPGDHGKYLVQIDESSLPQGCSLSTSSPLAVNFTAIGQFTCNNNFGIVCKPSVTPIQPMCIGQEGEIEVTDPLGADWEYQLDNGSWQDAPLFKDVDDGTYTVTARRKSNNNCTRVADPVTIENVVCAENDINQTPMNVPVSGHILTNDADGQGYGLEVESATYLNSSGVSTNLPFNTPTNIYDSSNTLAGSITLQADGNYTFAPATDYTGFVPIEYVLGDDQTSTHTDDATLMIEVFGSGIGNNPPIAQDDTNTTEAGVMVSDNVVIPNDSDPDGDALTVTAAQVDSDSDGIPDAPLTVGGSAINISGIDEGGNPVAVAGTLSLDASGNYTFTPSSDIDGNGTPFTGTVYADYTITDGNGGFDSAMLTIMVIDAGDNQTFANDDANLGPQGQAQTGNIMGNDWDPESDTQTIGMIDTDGDGTVDTDITGGGDFIITQGGSNIGTLTIDETDGSYTWTPEFDFIGTAVIPYSTCDDVNPDQA